VPTSNCQAPASYAAPRWALQGSHQPSPLSTPKFKVAPGCNAREERKLERHCRALGAGSISGRRGPHAGCHGWGADPCPGLLVTETCPGSGGLSWSQGRERKRRGGGRQSWRCGVPGAGRPVSARTVKLSPPPKLGAEGGREGEASEGPPSPSTSWNRGRRWLHSASASHLCPPRPQRTARTHLAVELADRHDPASRAAAPR
jgi:hypothetical protein